MDISDIECNATHDNQHTGREPENAGIVPQEIAGGSAVSKRRSNKLHELAREFYLFTLGPMYVAAGVKFDLLEQYKRDTSTNALDELITVSYPAPIINGIGPWSNIVQGVPLRYADSLRRFVLQFVFVDRSVKPFKYWRAVGVEADMATPQSIELSTGAVEVFLPTGVDYMIGLYRDPAMSHWLTKNPPEREIVDESARYFSSVMPGLFNDLSISRGGIR